MLLEDAHFASPTVVRAVRLSTHFVGLDAVGEERYVVTSGCVKDAVEKRHHKRYRLAATVNFSWESADHRMHQGHGQTRDCSISGAFVVTSSKLPIGSILEMDFSLPRLLAAGRGAQLKTRGDVIRIEPNGFAVLADMGPSSLLHHDRSLSGAKN